MNENYFSYKVLNHVMWQQVCNRFLTVGILVLIYLGVRLIQQDFDVHPFYIISGLIWVTPIILFSVAIFEGICAVIVQICHSTGITLTNPWHLFKLFWLTFRDFYISVLTLPEQLNIEKKVYYKLKFGIFDSINITRGIGNTNFTDNLSIDGTYFKLKPNPHFLQ